MNPSVAETLRGRTVCICAGPGGVGKTTTSAAIALGMAARGLRVAVVTIDPALRLADALGLEALDNEPRRVAPERLAGHGIEMRGELWAMMLDPKQTFDELIGRLAPDAASRDRVLANRVYQGLSSAVAGSQEYTAIARLYDLHRERRFDLLVLDTPPTRNALDFLDAPDRLTQFFEGRALQALLRPAGLGLRLTGGGGRVVGKVLERLTGIDLLSDVAGFFNALGGMIDGLRERARSVDELLGDEATAFLVVTSPRAESADEAVTFRERLRERSLPYAGAIVNRVHSGGLGAAEAQAAEAELRPLLGGPLAAAAAESARALGELAGRDAQAVARLRARLGDAPLHTVGQLGPDVHDVDGLVAVHAHLFGSAGPG